MLVLTQITSNYNARKLNISYKAVRYLLCIIVFSRHFSFTLATVSKIHVSHHHICECGTVTVSNDTPKYSECANECEDAYSEQSNCLCVCMHAHTSLCVCMHACEVLGIFMPKQV